MRCVIFINGIIADYSGLKKWIHEGDYLVCADGGVRHCLALGLQPSVIVGDLDSASPEVVEDLAARGVAVERHPPAKDQTDLELAIERVLVDGAEEILLLGALGGRLDQTLANLLILAQREWPIPIRLAEENQLAQVLSPQKTLVLDGQIGSTVSVVPLSSVVKGITFSGLAYPLENATLHLGSTRGISNEIASHPATIRVDQGKLLVIQTL
jgi:thiamine pyrophosphokinase